MKKTVERGDVVVYKDKETGEIGSSIITFVTGRKRHQYHRVGMNGLGMIMDHMDDQLKIQGLNSSLKGTFSSLDEIFSCKKVKVREEALYALFYYVQHSSSSNKVLHDLLEKNNFTTEGISKYFSETNEKEQLEMIDNGFMNILSAEDALKFLQSAEDEDVLFHFIKAKNDRRYFFNENRELIEEKINTVMTQDSLKKRCLNKLLSLSWDTLVEKPEYIDYIAANFNEFQLSDKEMFLYRLNTTLVNIHRSEYPNKETILNEIVSKLSKCQSFVNFVSNNIGEYFRTLSRKNDYDLGYYFDLLTFVNLENFKSELLSKVKVMEILDSPEVTTEIIDYIYDNELYDCNYDDGSNARQNNLSKIAGHKNTSSRVLQKIVFRDETYLSGDSFGKWDVVSALKNPNANPELLLDILLRTKDDAFIFGCLENPNCPKNAYEKFKKEHGKDFVYSTSGFNLVHTFS